MSDTFEELRGKFDGSESFMNRGHQIIKMRRSDRQIPEWSKDNKKVQAILVRSFPGLRTNPRQRARAARWAVAIQLYYRVRMTKSHVAQQMKLDVDTVRTLLRNINRAANGKKTNGKGDYTGRPRNRPKK